MHRDPRSRGPPTRVTERLNAFVAMGVQHLWIIDLIQRIAYTYTASGLQLATTDRLAIPNTPIYLDLKSLFAELD